MPNQPTKIAIDFIGTYSKVEPHQLIDYTMSDGRRVRNEFMAEDNSVKVQSR